MKTDFLHGVIEEVIYMTQPDSFLVPGKKYHVCKLKNLIYGLKQSPRQMNKRFGTYMVKLCSDRSFCDCFFFFNISKVEDGSHIYLVLYVEGMLIAAKKICDILKLKELLSYDLR